MKGELAVALNTPRASSYAFDLAQTGNQLVFMVANYSVCTVQLVSDATTAQVTLRRSNDGDNPVALEVADSITGSGMSNTIDCSGFMYLHVVLTTTQSGKTGRVIVCGKDA